MKKTYNIALAAALVLGGGALLSSGNPGSVASTTFAPVTPAFAQEETIELAPSFSIGEDSAPIEIIEYASFTCPHCADFHERVWDDLKADYIDTGLVKFTYNEVYFDKYGLWAGMIARCGGEMRYFGIADVVFETQRDWIGDGSEAGILENLKGIGRSAGLSDEQMDMCLNDQAMAQSMVAAYQHNAGEDDISGTPTFIINGEKYSNMTYDDLKEILDGLAG